MHEHVIPAQSGLGFAMKAGQTITIIDPEGQQVADFFAVSQEDHSVFLSPGITMGVNMRIQPKVGDVLYSNRYHPMFTIMEDDVGCHDMLYACCRPELYERRALGLNHNNCFDNINMVLGRFDIAPYSTIQPFNIFMNAAVLPDNSLQVREPISRPGDKIVLRAEMDLIAAVAACSMDWGPCNAGRCKPIKVVASWPCLCKGCVPQLTSEAADLGHAK